MSSSNAPSPRQTPTTPLKGLYQTPPKQLFSIWRKTVTGSQINQPAPSESLSRWESLGNLQLSKEWTLGANRPYISWVEDVSSRHWLQVWLGRCIRWSWQICLIPPWILWIWFRNGSEMAVFGHQKARCREKTKKMLMLQQQEPGSLAGGGFLSIFFESLYVLTLIFCGDHRIWRAFSWTGSNYIKKLIDGGFAHSKWQKFRNLSRHSRWNSSKTDWLKPQETDWRWLIQSRLSRLGSFWICSVTWSQDFPFGGFAPTSFCETES